MDITNTIVQKVANLCIWDDVFKSQLLYIIDSKNSVVSSQVYREKITEQKTICFIENRCGKAGFKELARITAGLDWESVATLIYITDNIAEVKNVAKIIPDVFQENGDLYGVDPDYFFSLVPLSVQNHKGIENFIVSLKSRVQVKEKIKHFIKKVLILLNCSSSLYERYVYFVNCNKPQG